jgi:hypothetical protein
VHVTTGSGDTDDFAAPEAAAGLLEINGANGKLSQLPHTLSEQAVRVRALQRTNVSLHPRVHDGVHNWRSSCTI